MSPLRKKRLRLMEERGNRCEYCGRWVRKGELTLDHIIPKSKGGTNADDNLLLACRTCNEGKADHIYTTRDPKTVYFIMKCLGRVI